MATATVDTPTTGLAALSRAVVSAAADFVQTVERAVVGEQKVRTAQGNAYAALCEDRARAQARDEMDALVKSLLAAAPRTPRPAPQLASVTHLNTATRRRTARRRPATAHQA